MKKQTALMNHWQLCQYLRKLHLPQVVPPPDLATLKLLQDAHLKYVPYENLDICEEDKQVIDDYIACKDARADRMAEKLYEKGRKDVKRCIRIRKLIRRCMILSAIVTVVLIQYNKNEKLRESLEELLKMFRDRTVNESEEDF